MKGNNSLIRVPVTLERIGYVCARLEKIAASIEAAGGVPGDRNAGKWLANAVVMVRRVQREKTTIKQTLGCQLVKHEARKKLMVSYRNRIRDLEAQVYALTNQTTHDKARREYSPTGVKRTPGSIVRAGDPIAMAQQIAESIEGVSYVFRTRKGSCFVRRKNNPPKNSELIGCYDEGASWRTIAEDLVA